MANVVLLLVIGAGAFALLLVGAPEVLGSLGVLKFDTLPVEDGTPINDGFRAEASDGQRAHNGVDFGAPLNAPAFNVAPGVVVQVERNDRSGNFVIVRGRGAFIGVAWGYAHLAQVSVEVGQELEPGELVGLVGNSGKTCSSRTGVCAVDQEDGAGAHLHFTVLDPKRGFKSVDPAPFFPAPEEVLT